MDKHLGEALPEFGAPVRVAGPSGIVTALAAGSSHLLTLRQDGTVWAWGENSRGQSSGHGTAKSSQAPVQVQGLSQVTALAVGSSHSVALREDGTVWAWGNNSRGQLVYGTNLSRKAPVQVMGLSRITAVVAGAQYTLALREDGTVWAWGTQRPRRARGWLLRGAREARRGRRSGRLILTG